MAETLLQKAKRLGIKPAGQPRSEIIAGRRTELEQAQIEEARISSPLERTKQVIKDLGEMTGITPTGRRIAAGIAPIIEQPEDLANVVEELAGGVSRPRKMGSAGQFLESAGLPTNVAEGVDIALDLPLISLGLSKSISQYLAKQAPKIAGVEALQILDKPLFEFLPEVLKKDILAKPKAAIETVQETAKAGVEKVAGVIQKGKETV